MLLPPFYRVEYLSSIFLGFLSLPVTALKKNVFAPNWFPSSLPIYSNPLIAKAGKTYSSDSCSCWPTGKKNGSDNCDVWNQDFFIAVRRGVPVCPFYRDIVSQQILESKKNNKWKLTNQTNIKAALFTSGLKEEDNKLDNSYKIRGKERRWNVLLYFENRNFWNLKRKIPQRKKKRKNKKMLLKAVGHVGGFSLLFKH